MYHIVKQEISQKSEKSECKGNPMMIDIWTYMDRSKLSGNTVMLFLCCGKIQAKRGINV